jgi:hypothetical protein
VRPNTLSTELSSLGTWKNIPQRTRERTRQCSEDGENIPAVILVKGTFFGHSVLYIAGVPYKLQHPTIFMDFEYWKGRFDMCGFN